ncbi:MAG: hypothetical protein QOI64_731 [Solirubrobacteraceae bacterium]|jgi:AcrR family transcriptional regulator|nr:hypothetical protein [Solirubrobacteraceae bacterium]
MPRRSAAAALETRRAIVDRAVDVASVDGLDGLTIGRLAGELEMSKAGVIGHFGTKEKLQLATLERAIATFRREVWEPAAGLDPGLERLRAIAAAWISYLERDVFPGGCFLTAASTEWDGREGPVRDAVRQTLGLWHDVLAAEAARAGLDDPGQVAFEMNSIAMGLNQALQLDLEPKKAPARARKAMGRLLA